MRHVPGNLLLLAGTAALLAGGAPVGVADAAAAPSLTSAVASLRAVSTASAPDQFVNVVLPPRFAETVSSSSVSGASSDDVSGDQTSTLRGGAVNFAGIISDSSLTASADDEGMAMDPLGESSLTVDFTVDATTTLLLEGVLVARVSGASPSCSEASLAVTPGGPSFEAADGPGPGCDGDSRVVVDDAIRLAPGAYTISLALSTHAFTGGSGSHAQGSGSWNFDIMLCTNVFTGGPDVIHGTPGADVLCGGGGRDTILGGRGSDTIKGGNGNDRLRGGPEPDDVWGGAGNDLVDGGLGDSLDRLYGGPGADRIMAGDGSDRIYGASLFDASGDLGDTIASGPGNDRVISGPGRDLIEGKGGDDLIVGGRNGDTIRGGPGEDTVRGEGGNDRVVGNRGEDLLDGGAGNDFANACDGVRDVVVGGAGRDRAVADRVDLVFGSTERRERCG